MQEANGDRSGQTILRAVLVSLCCGVGLSALVTAVEYRSLVVVLLVPITVFWSWVALGTCIGLFLGQRLLGPMARWMAHVIALSTALLCAGFAYTGVHDQVLRSIRPLLRFNQDLAGYYLVAIQLWYFGVAGLASLLMSVGLLGARKAPHRPPSPDRAGELPRSRRG